MSKSFAQQVILGIAGALVIIIAAFLLSNSKTQVAYGSVPFGNEYRATSTRAAVTGTAITSYIVLTTTPGSLGSVVITGANTGIINLYDGTTTGAHSDYATTTLATIPASTAAGTYTFDVVSTKGIVFELSAGLMPTTTITFR